MSDEMVSAEEARAMLDGVPDLGETVAAGQDTLNNAVTGGGRYGVAVLRASELLGDMERLARTVIALHAIIEGRTTAPSFEEDNAARRAGLYPIKLAGRWHLYDNDGRMRAWPVTENGVRDGR